jgi:glucose-1-phosphate thymidylyltransferase
MKGLILSGGFGTRLRPLTYSQQKQLIPVANKPILFYTIEHVIEAGAEEIGIIIGPNKEHVIATVESKNWNVPIKFIYQDEPKGLAHTIKISKEFLKDSDFIMYLGDNLLKDNIKVHANTFKENNFESYIMLCEVPNPSEFGIAIVNNKGEIEKLIEKPEKPPSNLAVIGVYFFTSVILKAVEEIKPSWRNQFEITDAIQWLIDHGHKVGYATVTGWWKDTGKPEDIIHANRLVLDEIKHTKNLSMSKNAKIDGRVVINENCVLENGSLIKGPAIIGKNCKIINSYIGPYTSIGDNCEIIDAGIEDSVIMDGTKIIGIERIVESLIGRGANIIKNNNLPKGHKLVIGDNSKVGI